MNLTITRYLGVVGSAYLIDLGGYAALVYLFNFDPIYSNLILKVFCSVYAFFLHRAYTFNDSNTKIVRKSIVHFGLAFIYAPLSSFCLLFVQSNWVSDPLISKLLVDVGLFFIFYLVSLANFR